jgi:release factor glutamine methyltransferase
MFVEMELKALYRKYLQELQLIYDLNEASVITSMIFESIAGIPKTVLIKDPAMILSEDKVNMLDDALEKLLIHTPVQYVTGEAWFYNMKFKVSPAVLIPRPETAEMVNEVTHYLGSREMTSLIDIGTGSGCIAISIKKKLPQTDVTALDVSTEAIVIAEQNASKNNVELNFQQLDFLNESNWTSLGRYDVIVSNPPYIPIMKKISWKKNVVDFEPAIALFAPAGQPLVFFEKIALFGKRHLNEKGKVFMEVHEDLAKDVVALFTGKGYKAMIKKTFLIKTGL